MTSILVAIGELFNNLGATIVLPIVLSILGLILGMKFTSAIRSGVIVAVAFVGIFLTVGLLGDNMAELGVAFAERTGTGLDIIDIGWPAASAIAFGTPVGNLIIPIALLLNILLLVLGLTKTLNIDVWNYWHQAFIGSVVAYVTGSVTLGLVAAAANVIMTLFLADWSQPFIEKYFKLPGVSIPHLQSAGYMLLAVPFAALLNKIPFLKKIHLDPDNIRRRLGLLGEPVFLGLFIGVLLAALAGQSFLDVLYTGINIAAVMILIPRMVGILVEGLSPVADAARKFMMKKFPGREFFIGLDSAVLVGSPAVIASGLLMIPVYLGMALLLAPLGNRTLPFIDLADGVFVTAMIVPLVGGDLLMTLILGAIVMGIGMIFTTLLSPAVTAMVAASPTVDIPTGFSNFTVMSDGAIPHSYIFYYIFQSPVVVALLITALLLVGQYLLAKKLPLGEKIFKIEEETENN